MSEPIDEKVSATACTLCGCVVVDTTVHTEWHKWVTTTRGIAERAAMFTQTIGTREQP